MDTSFNENFRYIKWILLFALGVFLIVGQHIAKEIVYNIFGAGLMLTGLAVLISPWKRNAERRELLQRILGGALLIVVGLWIIFYTGEFDAMLNIIIGFLMILGGFNWLAAGWTLGKNVLMMVLGAAAIALGILVLSTLHAATTWIVITEGICLIYSSIAGLICENRQLS